MNSQKLRQCKQCLHQVICAYISLYLYLCLQSTCTFYIYLYLYLTISIYIYIHEILYSISYYIHTIASNFCVWDQVVTDFCAFSWDFFLFCFSCQILKYVFCFNLYFILFIVIIMSLRHVCLRMREKGTETSWEGRWEDWRQVEVGKSIISIYYMRRIF
jgi:hypothetical protein